MFRLLYSLYFLKLRFKSFDQLYTRILVRAANILFPLFFKVTSGFAKNKIPAINQSRRRKLIVSLTSFPARIDKVHLTIETILRQKIKPDAIFLNLYYGEFKAKEKLPKSLLDLENRGLEIKFCPENLMPHLKYYYTMLENPDADIITIDDDVLYPPDLIEKHLYWNSIYHGSIICPVTRSIGVCDGLILPYREWEYSKVNSVPSVQNLTMGVGSAFYPAHSLDREVFNTKVIKEIALRADDLWLKIMSLRNNSGVVSIAGEFSRFFIPVIQNSSIQLMDLNILEEQNDMVFKNLLNRWNISASDLMDKQLVANH